MMEFRVMVITFVTTLMTLLLMTPIFLYSKKHWPLVVNIRTNINWHNNFIFCLSLKIIETCSTGISRVSKYLSTGSRKMEDRGLECHISEFTLLVFIWESFKSSLLLKFEFCALFTSLTQCLDLCGSPLVPAGRRFTRLTMCLQDGPGRVQDEGPMALLKASYCPAPTSIRGH